MEVQGCLTLKSINHFCNKHVQAFLGKVCDHTHSCFSTPLSSAKCAIYNLSLQNFHQNISHIIPKFSCVLQYDLNSICTPLHTQQSQGISIHCTLFPPGNLAMNVIWVTSKHIIYITINCIIYMGCKPASY